MGISFGNTSWAPAVSGKSKEEHQKVAEYLDQIVIEAYALARIWENVAGSVLATGIANAETDLIWIRLVERPEWTIYSKSIPKSRLEMFYEKISTVLGKAQKGETDFMICKIGGILQKRNLTRNMIEEDLRRIKNARFFSKQKQVKEEISIAESVILLNSEVLALATFAKEFRTKI